MNALFSKSPLTSALVLAVTALASSHASATACYTAWASSAQYSGGAQVSYSGYNYQAAFWTQNNNPSTNSGASGSGMPWTKLTTCGGTATPTPAPTPSGFALTQAQFNQIFPTPSSFYTYSGLVAALTSYPAFGTSGTATVNLQEIAAFLANVGHETGSLQYVSEIDQAVYCDSTNTQYPCASGQEYYGRGPLQISWNFNYGAAGAALGQPLLANPGLVASSSSISWSTGIWYWMTQVGPGTMTGHTAMTTSAGFGQAIRSINGSVECNGNNVSEMQDRVSRYQTAAQVLGVTPGNNLTC